MLRPLGNLFVLQNTKNVPALKTRRLARVEIHTVAGSTSTIRRSAKTAITERHLIGGPAVLTPKNIRPDHDYFAVEVIIGRDRRTSSSGDGCVGNALNFRSFEFNAGLFCLFCYALTVNANDLSVII